VNRAGAPLKIIAMSAAADALEARALACHRAIASIEANLVAERERRQQIIVGMRDEGLSWARCARAIGLSPSQCATIVANAPEPVTVQ
jgi:hypothetical protein